MSETPVTTNPVKSAQGSGKLSPKYYCGIRLYEYRRPRPFDNVQDKVLSTITMPLPTQLMDISASGFSNIDMGVVGDIMDLFRGEGTENPFKGAIRKDGIDLDKIKPLLTAAGNLGSAGAYRAAVLAPESIKNAISNNLPGGSFKSGLAGMIPAQQLSTAIEQSFGAVPNPNPAVRFNGPVLRDMNLTWYFSPKNEQESNDLSLVIQTLKNASLPSYAAPLGASISGILKYPKIVQLNFYPWDLQADSIAPANRWGWTENSIIKMKRCFMSSVNVNYNPGTVPSFFANHKNSPVICELSIQFKEIEYLTAESWGSKTDMEDLPASREWYPANSRGSELPRTAVPFKANENLNLFGGSSSLSDAVL
jgi:hypothetical protein